MMSMKQVLLKRFCFNVSINLFMPIVVFHMETSHLIRCVNKMTGFYIRHNQHIYAFKSFVYKLR